MAEENGKRRGGLQVVGWAAWIRLVWRRGPRSPRSLAALLAARLTFDARANSDDDPMQRPWNADPMPVDGDWTVTGRGGWAGRQISRRFASACRHILFTGTTVFTVDAGLNTYLDFMISWNLSLQSRAIILCVHQLQTVTNTAAWIHAKFDNMNTLERRKKLSVATRISAGW